MTMRSMKKARMARTAVVIAIGMRMAVIAIAGKKTMRMTIMNIAMMRANTTMTTMSRARMISKRIENY